MAMERTLILVKPDAMQRGLAGEVLARLERRGLRIAALRLIQVSRELAERHYAEHQGKPFYEGLLDYITACPIVAAVFEGTNAVAAARQSMGATNPVNAAPGTIRGDGPQPRPRLRFTGVRSARDLPVLPGRRCAGHEPGC
jgi:nucleoside-diphosphate kinase